MRKIHLTWKTIKMHIICIYIYIPNYIDTVLQHVENLDVTQELNVKIASAGVPGVLREFYTCIANKCYMLSRIMFKPSK